MRRVILAEASEPLALVEDLLAGMTRAELSAEGLRPAGVSCRAAVGHLGVSGPKLPARCGVLGALATGRENLPAFFHRDD